MSLERCSLASLALLVVTGLLSGCSTTFAPGPDIPTESGFGTIGGVVHGGQQVITGSTVQALQTSSSAYGGASTVIASSITDSYGSFSFPATTTCTAGTVVYLYSTGGEVATGITNPGAGLLAMLGTCPANGLLVNAVVEPPATAAYIYMNEVSTVAAAYALAGFAITADNTPTDPAHIGAPTAANALAQTGLQNAAATAGQMYAAVIPSLGSVTGQQRSALATTPAGNGLVPQALIDTIANILAACVNSDPGASANCTTLFNDARSGGGQAGTRPTDTAQAAIYLAQHPYSPYVGTLFNLVNNTAAPFTPALGAAPTSFAIELRFQGGGLDETPVFYPQTLAIDAPGNVWVANLLDSPTTGISKLSPLGVSLAGTGGFLDPDCFIGAGGRPTSIAIATSGAAWIGVSQATGVCVLGPAGNHVAYTTLGPSDDSPDGLEGLALDASGNAWVTDSSGLVSGVAIGGRVWQLSGTAYDILQPIFYNGLNFPLGIAIDSPGTFPGHTGDIWVGNFTQNFDSVFTPTGAPASFSPTAGGGSNLHHGAGVAIDSNGSVWTVISDGTGGVAKTSPDGASGTYFPQSVGSGNNAGEPYNIAIDGAGKVFYTTASQTMPGAIQELDNSGNLLSPVGGFVPILDVSSVTPLSIAVDGSGNVWYTMAEGGAKNTYPLRELVGVAVPVATPLAYGVAEGKLGSRP